MKTSIVFAIPALEQNRSMYVVRCAAPRYEDHETSCLRPRRPASEAPCVRGALSFRSTL